MAGSGIYVVSPTPLGPIRGFTLTDMADAYFDMSKGLAYMR